MKFNWVNLLATILILAGVYLLIERHMHGKPARPVPTVEAAKADIERQIALKLGRPLTDAEGDMIEVTKSGEQINITLHQPLPGRIYRAVHPQSATSGPSGGMPGGMSGGMHGLPTDTLAPSIPDNEFRMGGDLPTSMPTAPLH